VGLKQLFGSTWPPKVPSASGTAAAGGTAAAPSSGLGLLWAGSCWRGCSVRD
jgi:hypothetical protein